MSINIAALQTFSDSDLLALYRWAMASNAAGQTRTINGRTIMFPQLKELMLAIEWLETRIQTTADASGGNIAFAQFNRQT